MTDLRKKHIAEFAGGFPLLCVIFIRHGVAVYIFHDMICFPPAHLQDVFLWDVEGGHFAGEVVTELVYGKMRHSQFFLRGAKKVRDIVWMSLVDISLCLDQVRNM